MKGNPVIILCVMILWTGAIIDLHADALTHVEDLSARLQLACLNHNIFGIRAGYDFEGVPRALIDQQIYVWQEYFNQNDKTTHWTFEKIGYRPLEQIQADKTINQKAILSMIQPQNMNGTMYEPNLKIIGFITATFKQGSSEAGSMVPVGIAADGSAKLVMLRPVKSQ